MPIYEYECLFCGNVEERYFKQGDYAPVYCSICNNQTIKIPSLTGYRRDHTVAEDK